MLILTQDNSAIYDFDTSLGIFANEEDKSVYLLAYGNQTAYKIGEYTTFERAKEVVADIFMKYDYEDKYEMPW